MRDPQFLFSQIEWYLFDRHRKAEIAAEIDRMDGDRLLNTSVEDLCDYFEEKYRVEVPVLRVEEIVVDQHETQNVVEDGYGRRVRLIGTAIEFTVPFDGDAGVFRIRPSTYTLSPPVGVVHGQVLVVRIEGTELKEHQVRRDFDSTLASMQDYLKSLRVNAQEFNSRLRAVARDAMERRREKLLGDRKLAASLGFKMRERSGEARTYVAPDVRRKLAPVLPPATTAPFAPERTLSDSDYEHILGVIQSMAQVMERSPSAFVSMDEESVRSHFLVQLNGHYEGQATGETFNYQGKTDILIRSEDKNIFVGECKFWGGPKKLVDTLDQVLGYSCWRDTKVAVIIFNRKKDFTNVLRAIQETVRGHPNCKRELGARSETSFKYVFAHRDDRNRELTLTVLAFDIPT